MSEKKFANTHYPGIKADPNEGRQQIDPRIREKFPKLIDALGEKEVSRRLEISVLIDNSDDNSEEVSVENSLQNILDGVRNLVEQGIGRIGLLGERSVDGVSLLQAVKSWLVQEAPWVIFEPFHDIALDRQFDDISRGFGVVLKASAVTSFQCVSS